MKRSYQQYCAENGALVRSGTFSLAQVGYDVLGLVAPYLDLESLRALMFCLLLEFDVGFNKFLCEVVVSQYSDKQRVTLSEIQRLLEKHSPALYRDCQARHIEDMRDGLEYVGKWVREEPNPASEHMRYAARFRGYMINMAQNDYYPLMRFLKTESCARCAGRLHTKCYWSLTRPLHLCDECARHITDSLKGYDAAKHADGYAWLSAEKLKALCWIPNQVKAADYAARHAIRIYSRCDADVDGLGVKKEYYFALDAQPHFRRLQ